MNPDKIRHNLNQQYPNRKHIDNQPPKDGAITGKVAIDLSKEVEE